MTWKRFPHYLPFVTGIHWWCGAFLLVWTNNCTNSRVAGDFITLWHSCDCNGPCIHHCHMTFHSWVLEYFRQQMVLLFIYSLTWRWQTAKMFINISQVMWWIISQLSNKTTGILRVLLRYTKSLLSNSNNKKSSDIRANRETHNPEIRHALLWRHNELDGV